MLIGHGISALIAVIVPLLLSSQAGIAVSRDMQADVDRLVGAAEKLTGVWPSQPPPPIREVNAVARHGRPVAPLLVSLLSDDPAVERDRPRWKVQQQAALALSRIYAEPQPCGRSYCDGDPEERIAHVKAGWLRAIAADAEIRSLSTRQLLDRFRQEPTFSSQVPIARALADAGDPSVIPELEPFLTHEDRHLRGNAAFIVGRLGDRRGFETIAAMLADRSLRAVGQGSSRNNSPQAQRRADRYYAAHLLGDLQDPRGVDLLISLLDDEDAAYIVPWALGEIGDPRAIRPLIGRLQESEPSARVLAIYALAQLNAREALPELRSLLQDKRPANFGEGVTVAEAARRAIAVVAPQG